ncbi:PAS domain-containing protein [Dongia sp.]|uniref:PAS domain-containing protein n=1 Tax=Dongia sp. TaxID=1977262 RepID=UPI0035B3273F
MQEQGVDLPDQNAGAADSVKPDRARFDLVGAARPAFRSQRAEALYRYWRTRREDGLPRRADIEPADIKSLLPYVLIVDIHQDPFRIYYRLVGTAVAHFSGLDFTGTFLDELAFDICATDDLHNAYRSVCETRKPGIGMAFAQLNHQSALDVEYVICPLVDEANDVRQCLVLEDYVAKTGTEFGRLRLARPA